MRAFAVQLPSKAGCTSHQLPTQPCARVMAAEAVRRRGVSAAAAASSATGGNDDVQGAMLEPSVANTPWARALGVAAATAGVAFSTTAMPSQGAHFLHLITYAVWLGSNVWNTFFVGLTMFKNMPRQTFGRVQSKLFPMFFALTTGCNLVLLGSLYLAQGGLAAAPTNAVTTLAIAAAASVGNWLFIEPLATKLMFQRYGLENKSNKTDADQAEIKRLYGQFGKWHGISSLNNLVVLAAAVAYGWILAGRVTLGL